MIAEFVNLRQAGLSREQALARLAAWHQAQGRRVLILVADEHQAQELDRLLWTVDPASFVPHALAGGPDQESEPVLIVSQPHNPNAATVQLLTSPEQAPAPGVEHLVFLVPAQEGPELLAYRQRYKELSQTPGVEVRHTTRLPGGVPPAGPIRVE
ncbi:MAG: DNA polymerase III subunit chi [Desulfarculus sp.]|nr:DNA polymerase III subunit chi [Desulfarculus sp.]